MVVVSSSSHQGRNQITHSLFPQHWTNNKSESKQETLTSKYCNDRSEAQEKMANSNIMLGQCEQGAMATVAAGHGIFFLRGKRTKKRGTAILAAV